MLDVQSTCLLLHEEHKKQVFFNYETFSRLNNLVGTC
jgi:hypothetical protein